MNDLVQKIIAHSVIFYIMLTQSPSRANTKLRFSSSSDKWKYRTNIFSNLKGEFSRSRMLDQNSCDRNLVIITIPHMEHQGPAPALLLLHYPRLNYMAIHISLLSLLHYRRPEWI